MIKFIVLELCALMAAAVPTFAAESYPVRPIRFVVPYAPGGGSDIVARLIGQKLGDRLGTTFVIDNRPGAASMMATELVAKAPADGYTLILSDAPHAINVATYKHVNYDAVKDFAPIILVANAPQILAAHPSFPVDTLKELLALPKAQTEKFAMGSAGQGSAGHMSYELLRLRTGLVLNHVPYKGGGAAITDLIAGQIPLMFNATPPILPHLQAKRVKGLGLTAAKRNALIPAIPTFEESGVANFVVGSWYGVLAPAGTPRQIVDLLQRESRRAIELPDVQARFTALAIEPDGRGPEDFRRLIESDVKRWRETAAQANLRFE
jgi:tripartite-type tricarboxylate transporter receptor subunit TctC